MHEIGPYMTSGSQNIFLGVLRRTENDFGRFRAVYGLWRMFMKIDPNSDPKMAKVRSTAQEVGLF